MMKERAAAGRAPSFEEALERVEHIVATMEEGSLSLDESVACYLEAAELLAHCRRLLTEAELRISAVPVEHMSDEE
jgi:exodeoxyribonuclease VII small subunit